MPELPEVETVRRGLAPALVGARFSDVDLRRADLRFPFPPDFAARLRGRRVEALSRRAKFLVASLDDGEALLVHLGMSGSFRIDAASGAPLDGFFHYDRSKKSIHDHVVFRLSNGISLVYNDPRRFGFMDIAASDRLAEHKMLRGLGLEPLDAAFDGGALARLFGDRRAPLKTALLDQSRVAGLGNIYVCEALFRARLSPLKPAAALARRDGAPSAKADLLAQAIKDVLLEAIAAGGSSLRDHRQADGSLGYFQHRFQVYDREGAPCLAPRCDRRIRRLAQGGRSTFYCPACQK